MSAEASRATSLLTAGDMAVLLAGRRLGGARSPTWPVVDLRVDRSASRCSGRNRPRRRGLPVRSCSTETDVIRVLGEGPSSVVRVFDDAVCVARHLRQRPLPGVETRHAGSRASALGVVIMALDPRSAAPGRSDPDPRRAGQDRSPAVDPPAGGQPTPSSWSNWKAPTTPSPPPVSTAETWSFIRSSPNRCQRNWALDHLDEAFGPALGVSIDADEWLHDELADELHARIPEPPPITPTMSTSRLPRRRGSRGGSYASAGIRSHLAGPPLPL